MRKSLKALKSGNLALAFAELYSDLESAGLISHESSKGYSVDHVNVNAVPASAPASAIVGEIKDFIVATPPEGWLVCDGSTFNIEKYPELYAALGTDVLPNFGGRFRRSSNPDYPLGSTGNDTTKMPNTPFTTETAGGHGHDYQIGKGGSVYNESQRDIGLHWGNDNWTDTTLSRHNYSNAFWTAGAHTHEIHGGDSETAPKWVAVLTCVYAGG